MKPTNFIGGLFLILLGTILLMNNLGYGSWHLIRLLPVIGPLLLILLGVSFLWKGKIPRGIAFAITILVIGGIILFFLKTTFEKTNEHFQVSSSDYLALSTGALDLNFGAGKLAIGAANENWAEGHLQGIPAIISIADLDKNLKLKIRPENNRIKYFRFTRQEPVWEINLSPRISWKLLIHTGAVKGDINLKDIPLYRLDLNFGASDMAIKLGGNGKHAIVKVKAGASNLEILIPETTGIKVSLDGALTKTNLEELGFIPINKRYVSTNYETAEERIDLDLNISASNFQLKRIQLEVPEQAQPLQGI